MNSTRVITVSVIISFVILFFVGKPLTAIANDTEIKKGELLSLKRCIEIALKRHPEITAAIEGKLAAESRVGQVKSNYYPQLEIISSYSRSHFRDTSDQYSGSLSLRQNIYDFGRTETGVRRERFNLETTQAEYDNVILNIIFNVTQSYYNLIKAKRLRDVAYEVVRQYEAHLVQAKGFYETGIRPRYDVTNAEVNLSNARLNLIKSDNAVKIAMANLNNSMGISEAVEYEIEDDLPLPIDLSGGGIPEPQLKRYEITLDKALSIALEKRPDLKSVLLRRKAAEHSVELARKNYNPTLSGTLNYGWAGNFPLERQWNLGATLTVPVFNGYLTRYQIAEAEANLNVARANEEALRQRIYLEVQQAYLALIEAEERIPTAELAVRQAIENLEIARGRYEAGVGSPIEVTDAETSYINAQASYIQAITDYRIAIAGLEKVMGRGHYEETAHR